MTSARPFPGYQDPFSRIERDRVIVVGGGIIGLCAAYAVVAKGRGRVKVTLLEAESVGHAGAASSDVNRVFRHLHGPDTLLTQWSQEAQGLWAALGRSGGAALLHNTGVLFLVERGDGVETTGGHVLPYASAGAWLEDALQVLDDAGLPYRRLTALGVEEAYPQFDGAALNEAVLDPGAGYVAASAALAALLRLCINAGVDYRPGARVTGIESDANGVSIHTSGGAELRAGAAVVAVNGWTGDLLPAVGRALTLTQQPLVYLHAPPDAPELAQGRLPVFISLTSDCYGFPAMDGVVKVANDTAHLPIGHPDDRGEPEEGYAARLVETVGRFLPSLRGADIARTHVCFYDRSADGRFLLDAHDAGSRVVYGCGMSGRAFKFAPVIGERLARFAVSGERPGDLASFRLR